MFCDYFDVCFVVLSLFIAMLITLVKILRCPGYLLQLWVDIQF